MHARMLRHSNIILSIAVIFILMNSIRPIYADEWEGEWSQDCKKGYSIVLSKSRFEMDAFETGCTTLGVRKIGSKYIADLSCEGEEGAHRERAQLEVKNDILNLTISGLQTDFGILRRCHAEKTK